MKTFVIEAQPRTDSGTRAANRARRQKQIPINIYGGEKQQLFTAGESDINKILAVPDALIIQVNRNGSQLQTVLQEVQYHPISDKVIHVDLVEVSKTKKVTMFIPVRTVGLAAGAKDGGQVIVRMKRLKVKSELEKLPDHIDINIEPMKIGDSVKVSDMNIEGLRFLDPPNGTIIRVQPPRAEIVTTVAAPVAEGAVPGAAPAVPGAEAKEGAPGEKPAAGKEEGKDKTAKGAVPAAAKDEKKEEKGKK